MKPDPNTLVQALDPLYEKALDGIPGFSSVEEMAKDYLRGRGSLEDRINTLISITKSRKRRRLGFLRAWAACSPFR